MTANEFIAWLDGFLDSKEGLTADQVATLRFKAEKLQPLKGLTLGGPGLGTPRAIGVGQAGGYVEQTSSARPGVYANGQYAGSAD